MPRKPPEAPEGDEAGAADDGPRDRAPLRRCIVSRQSRPVDELIRFVRDPRGRVVADLKRRLPGRGVWVSADRESVAAAARKSLFSRAFRAPAEVPPDLAGEVGERLRAAALGSLGLERRAGRVAVGFAEVEALLRRGRAGLVLHAEEAARDGVRKLDQAAHAGGGTPAACRAFTASELGLALGRANVVHAALERSRGSEAAARRCLEFQTYRRGPSSTGDATRGNLQDGLDE